VHRLLAEQAQDSGADVATAGPGGRAAPTAAHVPGAERAERRTLAAAAATALAAVALVVMIVFVIVHVTSSLCIAIYR
jgi:hypothetical protein